MRPFLTPKWLLSHLFVLGMVVVLASLGLWQLDRLAERKDRNAELREAMEAAPVDVEELLGGDPLDHTAVLVAGEYRPELSFFVSNRTFDSRPGAWLVTPVELADGRLVVVARGWVPRQWASGLDETEIPTPTGRIEVLGRILASVDGGRIGSGDTSILPEISRLDLERVEELLGLDVVDHWVQLELQAPPLGDLPVPVPRPGLDEGPHLSYAFQWFFFALATVVVYGLILGKRHRELGRAG